MARIFNTAFENSLHVLLLLDIFKKAMSADLITYTDFIIVYAKSFDMGDKNINGNNSYKYGELSSKRRMIKNSLKRLVLDGMVKAEYTDEGMEYKITQFGTEFVKTLDSEYSECYKRQAELTVSELWGMSETELSNFIRENFKNEMVK